MLSFSILIIFTVVRCVSVSSLPPPLTVRWAHQEMGRKVIISLSCWPLRSHATVMAVRNYSTAATSRATSVKVNIRYTVHGHVYCITRIFCWWKTFANEPNQQKIWPFAIAFWQGSCVFTSNNLGFADFIVANWSTIAKFANVWCSQNILVIRYYYSTCISFLHTLYLISCMYAFCK